MRVLIPTAYFLRVDNKFTAEEWLAEDQDLKSGPQYLYSYLFRRARTTGTCTVTQEHLSRTLKVVVRTIQSYINDLVRLEYISVQMVNGCGVYTLLLSPKVERLIQHHILDVTPKRNACPTSTGIDTPSSFPSPPRRADSLPQAVPDEPDIAPPTQLNAQNEPIHVDHVQGDHIARRGDHFAPSSYKERRDLRDQKSPLSPLAAQSPVPSPHRAPVRGESFASRSSTPRTQNSPASSSAVGDFERLWQAWPIKKSKLFASRVFASLARARKLPPIQALLAIVERFKRTDRHWLNGYAPQLVWWLKGECWTDEPVLAPVLAGSGNSTPQAMPDWMSAQDVPEWMRDPALIQARIQEIHQRFGLRA